MSKSYLFVFRLGYLWNLLRELQVDETLIGAGRPEKKKNESGSHANKRRKLDEQLRLIPCIPHETLVETDA